MGKVFYAYAVSGDILDSGAEASLDLPATPYEMLDALDKLRLPEGGSVKFRVDEYYRFGSLVPFLSEPHDLNELNALAQKLSELDDGQAVAFEGLLMIQCRTKKAPIELSDLIDLAYSTSCCHVVGEALNDSQLGRFCAESGFVPGAENLPDDLFELLDFERIGREHRQREGGVLMERTADHPGGYVEQHSELAEVYKRLDLTTKQPDYTILLEVSKGFFNDPEYDSDKVVQLKLPAAPEALDAALTALDVWDWREVGWCGLDCKVPALTEMLSDDDDIHSINCLAQTLADMQPKVLNTYKALLSATDCKTLPQAEGLMDTMDQYIFSPQYSSPIEVAKGELSLILSEPDRELVVSHMNLYQYGQALVEKCGGVLTEYGLIERKDSQPVQAVKEQLQWGGMEMT